MPCMRLRRYLMQSDFKAREMQNAKALLEKELKVATHLHQIEKEKYEEKKKSSLFSKIKTFFSNLL